MIISNFEKCSCPRVTPWPLLGGNSAHAKIARKSGNLTFFAKIEFSIEMREIVMKSENRGEMKFWKFCQNSCFSRKIGPVGGSIENGFFSSKSTFLACFYKHLSTFSGIKKYSDFGILHVIIARISRGNAHAPRKWSFWRTFGAIPWAAYFSGISHDFHLAQK